MKKQSLKYLSRVSAALALGVAVRGSCADSTPVVSYTAGTTYSQDFNSLWTNNTTPPQTLTSQGFAPIIITPAVDVPVDLSGPSQDANQTIPQISAMPGWYAINFGGNSNALTYDVDDGTNSNNALTAYFNPNDPINLAGTSNNMALGANTASVTGNVVFGVELVNNGTSSLNAISLSYTGEMFHEDTGAKSLTFGYLLTNATDTTAIPVSGTQSVGALNVGGFPLGAAGTSSLSQNLSVTNLPLVTAWTPGETLWLTWEMGSGGGGQGLAIDNLSFSAASVAGSPTLVWNATSSGAWDTVAPNWTGTSTLFANTLYNVVFGNTNVPLTISVDPNGVNVPSSITINNSGSGAYTFTGGSINGSSASLIVNGGTVILQSPNGFGIATKINSGVVVADNNNELGASSAVLNLNGGTLRLAGALAAGTRALQVNATSTIDTQGFTASFGSSTSSVPVIHSALEVTGGGDLNLGIQPTFGNSAAPAGHLVIDPGSTVTLLGNTRSSATDMWDGGIINGVLDLNTTVGGRFNFDAPGTFNINDGTNTGTNGSDVFSGTGFIQIDQGSKWLPGSKQLDSNGVVISNTSGGLGAKIAVNIHLNALEGADANHPAFVRTDVTNPNFDKVVAVQPSDFITVIGGTKNNGSNGKGGIGAGFANLIISGVISGDSDLNIGNDYKSGGSGNLTLMNHNTYNGVTMLNGGGNGTPVLYIGIDNALPVTTDVVFGSLSGAGAPSIDLSGHSQTVRSLSVALAGASPNLNQINNSGATPSTLTISGSITPYYSYSGEINDYGPTATDPLGSNFTSFAGNTTALVLCPA